MWRCILFGGILGLILGLIGGVVVVIIGKPELGGVVGQWHSLKI